MQQHVVERCMHRAGVGWRNHDAASAPNITKGRETQRDTGFTQRVPDENSEENKHVPGLKKHPHRGARLPRCRIAAFSLCTVSTENGSSKNDPTPQLRRPLAAPTQRHWQQRKMDWSRWRHQPNPEKETPASRRAAAAVPNR